MAISEIQSNGVPIKLWTQLEDVQDAAFDQLKNTAELPWAYHHVAAMGDVHPGYGVAIGSVIVLKDAIAPSGVGVDIGCGMAAIRTNLVASELPDDLGKLRSNIEAAIPVGFNGHDNEQGVEQLGKKGTALFDDFQNLHAPVGNRFERALAQCGTLGGGNHFISLDLDTDDHVWMMLHSGSRNIGKEIAEYHIAVARELPHNAELPDRALSVFVVGVDGMEEYVSDLAWAQRYASANRQAMLVLYKKVMLKHFKIKVMFDETLNAHHNYVELEHHYGEDVYVTRKGAISAMMGEYGIIPGSMGTKSFIVSGLGNPESFHSASHGAGRRMSRGEARRTFTVEDLEAETAGVECRKDKGVLDEIPSSYKDVDVVMANQADLVKIEAELRPVLTVKG